MQRVRTVIDSLCSPGFAGRGYFPRGDLRAALYLAEHYREIGLKPIGNQYFQAFTLKVNIVTSQPQLSIGKTLKPGKEFIVWAGSGSGTGIAKITTDSSACSGKVLSIHPATFERVLKGELRVDAMLKAAAWIIPRPKLTHSVRDFSFPIPVFEVLGSVSGKKLKFFVETQLAEIYSQNVVGMVEGTAQPDSFLVVTAHYDHLGTMGNVYFPGANDNASGVAMLLELAHAIAQKPLRYSVAFICFSGEEAGLYGSKHFVSEPLIPLKNIRFLLNLDLFATGESGITVVNGSVFKREFTLLDSLNRSYHFLTKVVARGKAANSDHHFFTEAGVPGFFVYQMGNWPHYHDVFDAPPLPLTAFRPSFELLFKFLEALCQY